MTMPATPQRGDFVRVRTRRWLVEDERSAGDGLTALRLACVDDDAQGEMVEVLWDAELDGSVLKDEGWASVAKLGTDDPSVFSAYLRTLRWNTATAADRDLFQAPFRAGIHQDAYQLLPLRKALRLPRVNLLIADDVGAGKTVEAGLVLREMLLRRRVDFVLVAAPAGMVRQWQDELEAKFGLSFTLVDRELSRHPQTRARLYRQSVVFGFALHHLALADGRRDLCRRSSGRARQFPAAGSVDPGRGASCGAGQRVTLRGRQPVHPRGARACRAFRAPPLPVGDAAQRSLQLLLQPARNPRPAALHARRPSAAARARRGHGSPPQIRPAAFRREDFRRGSSSRSASMACRTMRRNSFCPASSPNMARSSAPARQISRRGRPAMCGSLSSACSSGFCRRSPPSPRHLEVHRKGLVRADVAASEAAAEAFVHGGAETEDEPTDEDRRREADPGRGGPGGRGSRGHCGGRFRPRPRGRDAGDRQEARAPTGCAHRPGWPNGSAPTWRRTAAGTSGAWFSSPNTRTRGAGWKSGWPKRSTICKPDDRIASFTGATPLIRREELKRRFNADPAQDPLRILICTDAAREGINLQMRCHDLIHIDLPWNPARLEQRNGRIDRKLQPSPKVWCRYFVYAQREEDVVLQALVRKTELIRTQLGSAGQVIATSAVGSPRTRRHHPTEVAGARNRRGGRRGSAEDRCRRDGRRDRGSARSPGQGNRRSARDPGALAREGRRRSGRAALRFCHGSRPRRDVSRRRPSRRDRRNAALSPRPRRSGLCVRRLAGGARRPAHPPPQAFRETQGLAGDGAAAQLSRSGRR